MEQAFQSVENILAEAVEIAPAERRAFIAQACGGNAELRAKVERLLASHDRAGSFLEHPAMVLDTVALPANPVAVGARIGPYKLLEIIGEGGMGVVYLAEQQEPVRRQVAIKVIKPGMDSKQIVARFRSGTASPRLDGPSEHRPRPGSRLYRHWPPLFRDGAGARHRHHRLL